MFNFLANLFAGTLDRDETETLYQGLDDQEETIAKQAKLIEMQHEMILEYTDDIKQHEIDRYEIVKKQRPDLAHHYVPGTCDRFPNPDGWDKKPDRPLPPAVGPSVQRPKKKN
jgi:hypothetical protein